MNKFMNQLIHDFGRQLEGNRKAKPLWRFTIVALIKGEGVNPHELAQRVDQRTTRVPMVDGGVGLQKVLAA